MELESELGFQPLMGRGRGRGETEMSGPGGSDTRVPGAQGHGYSIFCWGMYRIILLISPPGLERVIYSGTLAFAASRRKTLAKQLGIAFLSFEISKESFKRLAEIIGCHAAPGWPHGLGILRPRS